MAFGLIVKNDANYYQIDDNYSNLVFKEKFTVAGALEIVSNYWIWEVTYSGEYPVIAVRRADGGTLAVRGSDAAAGTYDNFGIFCGSNNTAVNLEVYVFDVVPVGSTPPPMGLKVIKPDSRIAYHSGMVPLRYVTERTLSKANNGSTFSIDSSKKYAMCFQNTHHFAYGNSTDRTAFWAWGLSMPTGSSTGTHSYVVTNSGFGDTGVVDVPGSCFVIDVTNL